MNKKYELTDETIEHDGHTLHRIKALIDIPCLMLQTGDIGGWVESEKNLSHEGYCWVDGDAKVFGNAKVYDCAKVYGKAKVFGDARVYGSAVVHGASLVYQRAYVHGYAAVCGSACVYEMADVCGGCSVSGAAIVRSNALVCDGKVQKPSDILVVGPLGSSAVYATLNKISGTVCTTSLFQGTLDEFEKYVNEKHVDDVHGKDYAHFIAYSKSVLEDTQTK